MARLKVSFIIAAEHAFVKKMIQQSVAALRNKLIRSTVSDQKHME
jgi:hypothetical protein